MKQRQLLLTSRMSEVYNMHNFKNIIDVKMQECALNLSVISGIVRQESPTLH